MSSDSACPWDLRFSRPRAGSGPQRHPVQTPLSRGQQAMEEQPPDPAGSPNPRSGEPASRSGHCTPPPIPMHSLSCLFHIPLSRVPHGVGSVAPVFLMGRLRLEPGCLSLWCPHTEDILTVQLPPGWLPRLHLLLAPINWHFCLALGAVFALSRQ